MPCLDYGVLRSVKPTAKQEVPAQGTRLISRVGSLLQGCRAVAFTPVALSSRKKGQKPQRTKSKLQGPQGRQWNEPQSIQRLPWSVAGQRSQRSLQTESPTLCHSTPPKGHHVTVFCENGTPVTVSTLE